MTSLRNEAIRTASGNLELLPIARQDVFEALVELEMQPATIGSLVLAQEVADNTRPADMAFKLERLRADHDAGRAFHYAVSEERTGGTIIGRSGLVPAVNRPDLARVSYWIADERRGKGHATDAVAALIGYGSESLGFGEFEFNIRPTNGASQRVAQKLGAENFGQGAREGFNAWRLRYV